MIVKVTLLPADVEQILLEHVSRECQVRFDGRTEVLEVQRAGDSPLIFEATIQVRPIPTDCRD